MEAEKKFDEEVKKLTVLFNNGDINGFEFDRKFRKLSDKYLTKTRKDR